MNTKTALVLILIVLSITLGENTLVAKNESLGGDDCKMLDIKEIDLNGCWKFRRVGGERWHLGTVPGEVYGDLLSRGKIKDPFYGKNELDLQWIGLADWEYFRTFNVTKDFLKFDRQILECLGLDTIADVFINGQKVGEGRNMFRKYEIDVKKILKNGENEIRIVFKSPVKYGVEKEKECAKKLPGPSFRVDQPARNFVRKAQCHYGWDWGPCFPTMGIWRDIGIIGFSQPLLRYTKTFQEHANGRIKLNAKVGVDSPSAGNYILRLAVAGQEATNQVKLEKGQNEEEISLEVKNPKLWWPAGYGEQNLYEMRISVESEEGFVYHFIEKEIGFRKVELVQQRDAEGESFYFKVNGVPFFAKGANWIPPDSFDSRVDRDRYKDLLSSAKKANMNMLRVWGGGIYEADDFYEICDREGLLVWQDFMFSCAAYPADREFLENVREEVRYQVRRLCDHPCIVLWCGNNENEEGVKKWWGNQQALLRDYKKLYIDTIGRTVKEEDSSRLYWPSSPSSGGQIDPDNPAVGDIHCWEVWHGGKPFSYYLTVKPRFVSEFGFQSFPSVRTLRTVMGEEDLNPTSPMMEYHQRHPRGNALILKQMTDQFRFPFEFDDFVYLSQVQQGLAMKIVCEHWHRQKPYCMGTLYWQLNDIWPVASWSSLEYDGSWKALHYMAKRFFNPVVVSAVENEDKIEFWVTSDLNEEISGELSIKVLTFEGDNVCRYASGIEIRPLASQKVLSLRLSKLLDRSVKRENIMIEMKFNSENITHRNFHFLAPFKLLELPESDLSSKVEEKGSFEITIHAPKTALFVWLDAGNIHGEFSDNCFHMTAGETIKVSFYPKEQATKKDFVKNLSIKHLKETY